ncbi:hypothetical protein K8Q98_00315 [Candidatus Nomurabacteria bacterium]|nr:hypothetical protein [Candidatus Nomurabacteria bacterium]
MEYLKTSYSRSPGHWFLVPFIILPLPFLFLSDLVIEIYHRVAFPVCKIPYVKRSEYILIFDRARLQYLNPLQKVFCMYCGYANGLLRYQKEIAGRTEQYWCGIMHKNAPGFKAPSDQIENNFAKFGDAEDFKKKYPNKRR